MIFVFGGAWQGKKDFVLSRFSLSESDFYSCSGLQIDFSKKCISGLEQFALAAVRAGESPCEALKKQKEMWNDKILICRDISSGVVPVDPEMRKWRDENGKMCQFLSCEALHVYRVFCGLGQELK